MTNSDLLIDYDVFLNNIDIYQTMSDIPVSDFYHSLLNLVNPKYNKEAIDRIKRYKSIVKSIDNQLFDNHMKEKWAHNQLVSSLELITALLYADKLNLQNNSTLSVLKNNKVGKILFYPHYGSYMSILPLLASQGIQFTVLMDEKMVPFWKEILFKVSYGNNIKLHGIQSKNSMIRVLHDIKNGYNLMMYPDFSYGKASPLYGEFLSKMSHIPQGPVTIAKQLQTDLIPISMHYHNKEILPSITINPPIDCTKNTTEASLEMMSCMEKIILQDVSRWWCWEIYEDKIKKK